MSTPWQLFSPHRARVTALLTGAAPPSPGTLCLLGAGRCRDVDLAAAGARFRAIHLVDRVGEAIAVARGRQPRELQPRIHLHGGVELGGVAPDFVARLPTCDVVASTCLLSQLVVAAAPADRAAVVAAHLRALLALVVPGGAAVLVDDVASAPRGVLEARVLALGPAGALAEAETAGLRHPQTAPAEIVALLAAHTSVARVERAEPWIWTRVPDQSYLVHALRIWKRGPLPG